MATLEKEKVCMFSCNSMYPFKLILKAVSHADCGYNILLCLQLLCQYAALQQHQQLLQLELVCPVDFLEHSELHRFGLTCMALKHAACLVVWDCVKGYCIPWSVAGPALLHSKCICLSCARQQRDQRPCKSLLLH